jgi:hypothetical protein
MTRIREGRNVIVSHSVRYAGEEERARDWDRLGTSSLKRNEHVRGTRMTLESKHSKIVESRGKGETMPDEALIELCLCCPVRRSAHGLGIDREIRDMAQADQR